MPSTANVRGPAGRTPVPLPEQSFNEITARERFLRACNLYPNDRPPLWLMRQAGRALPEYRLLKERHNFLELVRTPELAAEVTLQPIRRFGFDAAILFSDILVVPEALGQGYHFREGGGIEMDFALRTAADIEKLDAQAIRDRLGYVSEAIHLVNKQLRGRTALIGFAGSPWTLANFMLEGGSSRNFTKAFQLLRTEPELFHRLIRKLTSAVTEYLRMQIEAGVDALQIFDTLGSELPPELFRAGSGMWMKRIVEDLNTDVPVIVFSKGCRAWDGLAEIEADVIGIDYAIDLRRAAAALPRTLAVQGNLDPALLLGEPRDVQREVRRLLGEMEGRPGWIFNLGHGVPPGAKLECIHALAETVRRGA